ncbi:MAG TPA: M20 aminoacylase family protein [Comamonas denitrificans]|nr:M20 aminoacylase family protein [Comamonas denitrificans]
MSAALAPHLSALVQLRRDLHSHPELSYQEKRTASQVAAYLHALGLPVHQGLGTTGLVASIHGQGFSAAHPGPSVGLRADMDALPLAEATGLPYASRHPGKMHACGHDGHTAMLLGAAHLLSQQRNFAGTVHLIFQPAEEGGAGAKAMMEDGLFQRFACQAVFALHNWPDLPQGQMAVRVGPIMAANIRFEIRVRGKGGHAALPHTTRDPVPVACAIVTQLQTLVSRTLDPVDSAVLTIGKIEAGTVENIIPNEAVLYGTLRTLRDDTQATLVAGIERIAQHTAAAHECQALYIHKPGYPNTTNSAAEAALMAQVMAEVVGPENTHPNIDPAMTSEDFGFMLQQVPGAYGWIGNGKNGQRGTSLHHPGYDFNDDNIALGARFWDTLARRWLEQSSANA